MRCILEQVSATENSATSDRRTGEICGGNLGIPPRRCYGHGVIIDPL